MDGDTIDGCLHPFQWSVVLRIDWYPFKLVQSVPPVYYLPKHRVPWREKCKDHDVSLIVCSLEIQGGLGGICEKPLASI